MFCRLRLGEVRHRGLGQQPSTEAGARLRCRGRAKLLEELHLTQSQQKAVKMPAS